MVCLAYAGFRGLIRLVIPALLIGASMAAVQYLAATSGLWNLAILAGGAAGLLICLPLGRLWKPRLSESAAAPSGKLPVNRLLLALAGYALLTLVTLTFQLSEEVKQALGFLTLRVPFPEVQTGLGYVTPAGYGRVISFLTHPGASLLYSSILAYLLFRLSGCYPPGAARRILAGTYQQLLPSSVGIMAMVSMAVIMETSGMTDSLARSLALGVGSFFPFTSAWIGALGSFMSGSNTNSNVVFGALQLKTAGMLKLNLPIILAAQSIGGSIGSAAAPAKVIVGASTGSLAGQEGLVLRKLIGYILALILLICLITAGRILLGGNTP
jgi:lactate permease